MKMRNDEFDKVSVDLDNFNEISLRLLEQTGSQAKRIKIGDLGKDTSTFNPFDTDNVTQMLKNKKNKTIIHDFYKKEYKYYVSVGADREYRFIMFQLLEELNDKGNEGLLGNMETILFLILSQDLSKTQDLEYVFSDALVNEFKNVLKEVEKWYTN